MDIPLQVTFRNLDRSEAVETRIRQQLERLERHHRHLVGCRVAVELTHHRHRKGNHFRVRIEISVPGAELVANREPDEHDAHADVYVAIRDAFTAVTRQLDELAGRKGGRGRVQTDG